MTATLDWRRSYPPRFAEFRGTVVCECHLPEFVEQPDRIESIVDQHWKVLHFPRHVSFVFAVGQRFPVVSVDLALRAKIEEQSEQHCPIMTLVHPFKKAKRL